MTKMKMSRDWLVSMLENDTLPKGMTYIDIVTGVSSKQEAIDFLKKQPELVG
jgi:glycerol-3-phosphate responsive antiterminator